MVPKLYPTSRFARRAGVTVRTLRYYDQIGLLRPSMVTDSGHRRYSDQELVRLQQILALKFLGFSLEQIREMLRHQPLPVEASLLVQKRMMVEKREQIDAVIRALESLEAVIARQGGLDWESLIQVIKVIQMQENKDWWEKHYSEEARKKIKERQQHYTEEQAQRDALRWQEVIDGMKAAAARGEGPASPGVQELARRSEELIGEFTMGDPEILEGLTRVWSDPQMPYPWPYNEEENSFVQRAVEIYRGKR